MTGNRKAISKVAALDAVIILAGWVLLFLRDGVKFQPLASLTNSVILGASLTLIGVITFFGFLFVGLAESSQTLAWLRHAIAAAFVMVYIVLIAYLFTSPQLRQALTDPDQLGFGKDIFTGFTTFLGVILAFYFTTQAAEVVAQVTQSGATNRVLEKQATIEEATRHNPTVVGSAPTRQ